MMRKLLSLFVCLCGLVIIAACHSEEKKEDTAAVNTTEAQDIVSLSADMVYFFYQETCPHCHDAAAYLHENYPNAKIKALNVKMPGNMKLFAEAVKTYKVGNQAGTPLICFGENYIMGWSDEDKKMLDVWIKPYEK